MSGMLFTVEQAAQRLALHPKTVLRLIREGRLKANRIGKAYRIQAHDLEAFVGAGKAPVGARAKTTIVTEIGPLPESGAALLANRLVALVHGATGAHLATSYDPTALQMKLVFIADARVAADFLSALAVMAQDL